VDASAEKSRRERLASLRARRDGDRALRALAEVESTARGDGNLMPSILEAVMAEATLGEIADRLRAVFGQHQETFAF
jgi:methylmalonyl-CoA mutase N-terminal domain/subunit